MFVHETSYRVRYADTDQMQYVYYGNYARLYEIGRVEAMRALGYSYRSFEESGIMMPVLDLQAKYLAPARYDELLCIRTTVLEMPGVRIKFKYEVIGEDGTLQNEAFTTLVFVNRQTNKPCKGPDYFLNALAPYFNE
ncbi:MAG: acyl-CoA thioesterase [Bacteroidia bacterium]